MKSGWKCSLCCIQGGRWCNLGITAHGDHGCSYGAIMQWWYNSIGTLKQCCSKPWNVFPVRKICRSHCSGVQRWLEKDCQKAKFVGEVFCWHSARDTESKHYNSCWLKKELFISGKWWPKNMSGFHIVYCNSGSIISPIPSHCFFLPT